MSVQQGPLRLRQQLARRLLSPLNRYLLDSPQAALHDQGLR